MSRLGTMASALGAGTSRALLVRRRSRRIVLCWSLLWLLPAAAAHAVSFDAEVVPLLSKAGCNQGGCHGNANGKGGFKLSLRGEDPEFDYRWMTREAEQRRVNRLEPQRSLLLLKATAQVPHQGGRRFAVGSLEFERLRDWIAAGTPRHVPQESPLRQLEVAPSRAYLDAAQPEVKLQVKAHFADGTARDVSRLATYELTNEVAAVDAEGRVRREAFGETTIMVRYQHLQVPVRLAFLPDRPGFEWNAPPPENYIDRLVDAKLQRLMIKPSELAPDTVFVRRVYLDALGVLPTADEARLFVEDKDPAKRRRLVDRLLARPEFADYWALRWSDLLRVEEKVLDARGVEVFHRWIRQQMAEDVPLDRFVRSLLRAEGSTYEQPPANFWRANRDPATRGETTARLFLGARLQCAKCHNHPFDQWTQSDYYDWAAVFARVDYEIVDNKRKDKLDKNEFVGEQIVHIGTTGSVLNPRTGRLASAKLLGGPRLSPGSHYDRLTPLAVWLTDAQNRRFAEVTANWIWYHLMGRGLVEPVDDFRATNPPSNPELLSALADDLAAGGYDLRHLVRRILLSRTYQLASLPNESNEQDLENFARAYVKRLSAEKLLDAQSAVIGAPARFAGYAPGLRAGQLPGVQRVRLRDGSLAAGDRFLKAFGKPERLLACECERSDETTLSQAFLLIGGDLNQRLADQQSRLAAWALSGRSDRELVEQLYWTALSRPPSDDEMAAACRLLSEDLPPRYQQDWRRLLSALGSRQAFEDRFHRLQDLAWAVMNSKEFVLRH